MTRLHLYGLLAWVVSVGAVLALARWWRRPAIEDDTPVLDDVDERYRQWNRTLWHPDLEDKDKTWT